MTAISGGAPMSAEAESHADQEQLKPFVVDVAEVAGFTIADIAGEGDEADFMINMFGRDLLTKPIVQTSKLSVFHETAKPGERVKPHRHGTHQVNYVLRGELIFGNQHVGPGMAYFTPDMLYSWRAGPEGAEWIEIHAGQPGIYVDRQSS
jgi:quercetin dioxygenase-like cupin family protein